MAACRQERSKNLKDLLEVTGWIAELDALRYCLKALLDLLTHVGVLGQLGIHRLDLLLDGPWVKS